MTSLAEDTVVNLARVPVASGPTEPAWRPQPRTWPALLAIAAITGLGYLVGGVVPGLRTGATVVFWLVGPGALVAGSVRLPTLVRIASVIPIGLAVLVSGGALLTWGSWLTMPTSTAISLLVVAITLAGSVGQLAHGIVAARDRRVAASPALSGAAQVGPADGRTATRAAALPLGSVAATVVAWALALPELRSAEPSVFGLLAAGSAWFWGALAGTVATLVLAVRMPRGPDRAVAAMRAAALWSAVALEVVVLRLTPSLVTDVPIYTWAYKHLGVVDQLLTGVARFGSNDIYLQWPGMFAGAGWLTVQSGLAPITIAQWVTPVINLACALLAGALLVSSRRVRELPGTRRPDVVGAAAVAGWLMVVASWIGQDYFAPQAVAIVLAGSILVLLPISREHRPAAVLIVALFLPLLATYQLTPYWILAVVLGLVVLRQAPLWVASLMVIAAIGYLLPRMDIIASYGLFTGFHPTGNVTVAPTSETSVGQQLTSLMALACAGVIWLSAGIAWLRVYRRAVNHWRGTGLGRVRSLIVGLASHGALAVMMLAGFGFILGQSDGGEVILRVYLSSMIPAAVLIADPLTRRLQTGWVGAVTWLLVVTTTATQASYGAWFVNRLAAADVQVAAELLDQVEPPAYTLQVLPNWPVRSTADSVTFADQLWNYDAVASGPLLVGSDFTDEADLKALEADVTSGAYVPVYLLVSEAMYAWNDYYGSYPPGAMERLTSELLVRPTWRLVRSQDQTMVFQYVGPEWPTGWDVSGRPIVTAGPGSPR